MGFNKLYRPLMRFIGNFFPKDHHKIMFDSGPSFSDNSRVLFEYIYSTIAERFIRPLAGERKNLLFFGSGKMASVSAAYHTIISPCKMQGIPVLHYLKEFFKQIVLGRTDYENLLPMTIGISNNRY